MATALTPIPRPLKLIPATLASALPQSRASRLILLIGHMRSGSTALSSVLCSHQDVSGYGEAHIDYGAFHAGGGLILNQWRRAAWRPRARYLFDKVLHNRYDHGAEGVCHAAHVIMLARAPERSIPSIRQLADTLGLGDWRTDEAAADYYERRMERLLTLWTHCHPARRIAMSHRELTGDVDTQLARLTALLRLNPPLSNSYTFKAVSGRGGGGDPLKARSLSKIVAGDHATSLSKGRGASDLSAARMEALQALYREFERTCCAPQDAADGAADGAAGMVQISGA